MGASDGKTAQAVRQCPGIELVTALGWQIIVKPEVPSWLCALAGSDFLKLWPNNFLIFTIFS